jgi:3-oxosteroid 1-dehydrogenase
VPRGRSLSESIMARTQHRPADHYDVIVAGSGISGVSAALAAAESGLSVAIFEKDELIGGGTCLSFGGIWVGCNHLAKAIGIADSREAVLDYMRFVAGGAADDQLMTAFIDYAPTAVSFFERCGVRFQLSNGVKDHYYPDAPGSLADGRLFEPTPISVRELGELAPKIRDSLFDPRIVTVEEISNWGGMVNHKHWDNATVAYRRANDIKANGPALIVHFVKALSERGAPIFLDMPIEALVTTETGIAGVRVRGGRTISARKGVVLATGGWEGDDALARAFENLPQARSSAPRAVSGDGWKLATSVGASTALIANNLAVILGFYVPSPNGEREPEFRQSQIMECLCPHTIIVNRRGERFSDETYFQETAETLRHYDILRREHRNEPCYLVFDSQYLEQFSFCGAPIGTPPPEWVARAETLADLAQKLNVDPKGLEKAVARFNDFSREGVDRDFHRGEKQFSLTRRESLAAGNSRNQRLGTLERSPFFGVRLYPGVFVSSGGVRMNRHAQAVDPRGEAIRKLYVVGNAAAHLEYGIGYQAGYSLASSMTFGYLAVQHMMAAATEGVR